MTKTLIRSKRLIHRLAAFGGLLLWCLGSQAEHYSIPLFAPAGPSGAPLGVLRILNDADESGTVAIWAIDDAGARFGPATFMLNARAAVEFDAADLVSGNAAKGLSGGIGSLPGDMRLQIDTDLDIVPLAYARAADGTLSAMHDTVPAVADAQSPGEALGEVGPYRYEVPVFNPASDVSQASRLRLINPGDAPAIAIIEGRDDSGAAASGGSVRLTLPAGAARTLTALELEAGGEGLAGRLGAGTGRWRLTVSSDRPLQAVNIAADGTGWRWNNLSTVAAPGPASAPVPGPASELARASGLALAERHTIPLFAPAGTPGAPHGLLRILNGADEAGSVEIWAIDDAGIRTGPATFTLNARAAAEFDASDLVSGNAAKGLTGGIGPVASDLRLEIDTDLDIVPLAYVRATDGSLSAMHDTVPAATGADASGVAGTEASSVATGDAVVHAAREASSHVYHVPMFNSASEAAQASRLRLINPGDAPAAVMIEGRDDTGAAAPGGNVRLSLPAGAARTLTALQLEAGGAGLAGRLGSGTGRWRLTISSDRPLQAVNAVASGAGRLNNLSTVAAETDGAGVPADFDLDEDNERAEGATWANGRVYVVDSRADKVFAYTLDGQRDAAADFDLDGDNRSPTGIAWSGSSFHVVDGSADKVFAYGADGQRQASADFDLHDDNGRAEGIVWANDRFHVVDRGSPDKVFVYGADGSRDASAEFGLDGGNRNPSGIAWADGRFYVADSSDRKVYAHGADGQRDSSADFDLNDGNAAAMGIVWVDGPFLVPDEDGLKVFAYAGPVVPGDGTPPDAQPSFAADSAPDDLTYTVGAAIGALTLPAASGGDGTLTYTLTPTVPGLSFDAATRQLGGTPTAAGTYAMTYTATDADGDAATLGFAIAVQAATGGVVPTDFDLDGDNSRAEGVAWANGRVYVVDSRADKAFAYGADGQRDAAAEFELDDDNRGPTGIAWSGTSLHVVDGSADKVFAYGPDGQRQAEADFDLHDDNGRAEGIVWANDLFFVVDRGSPDKVYAYGADGARDESAEFDLDGDNRNASGIAWADGRFYVADSNDGKVYAHGADGQRDSTADFDLNDGNAAAMGIVWADGPFLVADEDGRRVHAYAGPMGPGGGTPPDGGTPPGGETTYGAGDTIDSLPPGTWSPDAASAGTRVTSGADGVRIELGDGDWFDTGGHRYTCRGADGCEIAGGAVVSGIIVRTTTTGAGAADSFDLHEENVGPIGIAHAGDRFYVLDYRNKKVYAYRADGQHDAAADLDLDLGDYFSPQDIAYADGRFYIVGSQYQSDYSSSVYKVNVYHADGRRDAAVDFDLNIGDVYPLGIGYGDGRLYVVGVEVAYDDGSNLSKVYAYRTDGQRDSSADFYLNRDKEQPFDIVYASGRFHILGRDETVYAYRADGQRDASADFALRDGSRYPTRIVHANGRFHVLDRQDRKVYRYQGNETRDASVGFALDRENYNPRGIAHANGRLYVLDIVDHKVYAYRADGQRDASMDFALHEDNRSVRGIVYAQGRFYVVDSDYAPASGMGASTTSNKVYAYRADGQRDASAEFDLYERNANPQGIAYTDGRLYVSEGTATGMVYAYRMDGRHDASADFEMYESDVGALLAAAAGRIHVVGRGDGKVYAYWPDGQRDASVDFELHADNNSASGIVHAAGQFHVVDWLDEKVYAYGDGGEPDGNGGTPGYGAGDTISGLPAGSWEPDVIEGGRVDHVGAVASIRLDDDGYFEESGYRYTCRNAEGCEVGAADVAWVVWGTIIRTPGGVAAPDASPVFAAGSGLGDRTYTVGAAIEPLTLPEAGGGDGTLWYRLTPTVPGLSFDGATRRLSGTPSWSGDYVMAYTAEDADGDPADALSFAIAVESSDVAGAAIERFDLDRSTAVAAGIAHTDTRFYVLDYASNITSKVHAYRANGERDASADFDLHEDNDLPGGIVHVDGLFYLPNWGENNKVFAYRASGERDESADFDLDDDNDRPMGIAYANGRFYVFDRDNKVFAYGEDGQRDESADFDLHEDHGISVRIAYADGRFYVPDRGRYDVDERRVVERKAYAYRVTGERDESADFDLHEDNGYPNGIIAAAANLFYVVDSRERKVYAYRLDDTKIHRAGDTVQDLPSGSWEPETVSDARVTSGADGTRIDFDDGGYIEVGGHRFACRSVGGCEVAGGNVVSGTIVRIPPDAQPSFAADSGPGDLTFTIAEPIEPITLPAASGGDGALTYTLGPDVPGLTFDAATRRLSGTPTEAGTHAMTYTVTDADGDSVTLGFAITATVVAGIFDLHISYNQPRGITYANGRFYVISAQGLDDDDVTVFKIFAYGEDGQRDVAVEFDLHKENAFPLGIAYADGKLHVVDQRRMKVFAYGEDGQRDVTAEFDLHEDNSRAWGIEYVGGRFHILDQGGHMFAYRPDGQRDTAVEFDLQEESARPLGIAYADGLFHIVDGSSRRVYSYRSDGQPDVATGFPLQENSIPTGIAYANGRFFVLDGLEWKAYAYRADGQREEADDFHVHEDSGIPIGVAHAGGRFYVLDKLRNKVYAYRNTWERDAAADFHLDDDHRQPVGITYGDGRIFILDNVRHKVYAYRDYGQRDAAADFDLESANRNSAGIAYAGGRFYVLDGGVAPYKVYVYREDGQRDAAADFDLRGRNYVPFFRFAYAYVNDRFYIFDDPYDKAYAYRADGTRDSASDFELPIDFGYARGLAYANGRFYVVDEDDAKVYAYPGPKESTYTSGDNIGLPTGTWVPDSTSALGARVTSGANGTRVELDEGSFFEVGSYRYTCEGTGGCVIDNRGVVSGTLVRTGSGVAPPDAPPRFAASAAQNLTYGLGTPIQERMLPAASGGDGMRSYRLSPTVPGLSFDAATRQLTGTPTAAGTYAMTYRVTDASGDMDTLSFTITVAEEFTLDTENGAPTGIAYVDDRFYVGDSRDRKLYAYRSDWARDAASDFDLQNHDAYGIAYADLRFFVVDANSRTVYAYWNDGHRQRDAASDFTLQQDIVWSGGIAYANDRFYLVGSSRDLDGSWSSRVFAYRSDGQRDAASDFDLWSGNQRPDWISLAYADGRFFAVASQYVFVDGFRVNRVFAYHTDGQRDAASDFDLHSSNHFPSGITHANGRLHVVNHLYDRVYAYGNERADGGSVTYGAGDTIAGLPAGDWTPDIASGARVTSGTDGTRIEFDDDGYIETGGYRYVCRGAAGCEVGGGAVVSGTVVRTAGDRAVPRFATWREPTTRSYSVGIAIDTVTLPLASGGDGALTYTLTPSVPGLSFDAATRQLSGTPTEAGTYEISFSVTDADGDTAILSLTVTVTAATEVQVFDLRMTYYQPDAITFGNGRFYVADYSAGKVYIYRENGQRDAASDFDLDEVDGDPRAITYGNGRLYVIGDEYVGGKTTYKVHAYRENGQRDAASDFELHDGVSTVEGLAYANGRFYVVGRQYADGSWSSKVFAYGADGQHDASADFDLQTGNDYARSITYADNLFYIADFLDDKVYVYWIDGQRDAASDFDFDVENGSARGIAYANGLIHAVDAQYLKVYAYRPDGQREATVDFDLGEDSGVPRGIAHADGRFFVVNWFLRKVHAYRDTWERAAPADFELHEENADPSGIAYADGQIYVVDGHRKVFAYRSGGRDASADFDLHEDNSAPWGIVWAEERLYVLDRSDRKVYAYREGGERDMAVEFDLHGENGSPAGIAYAGGRFYVVDSRGQKVFAYREDGQRDAPAEFILNVELGNVGKIAYANGQFYVVDIFDTLVYAHASPLGPDVGDDGQGTDFATGDTVIGLPTGTWIVDAVSGASFTSGADATRVEIDSGGHIETDGFRFSCQGAGDCEIDNRIVVSGTIVRTAAQAPGFRAGSGPGEQNYSVGTAIDALTLPMGSGAGTLTYGLTPSVPGLSFDPATRRLTGTPSAAGTYAMTYTVANAGGDTATLFFDIDVISVAKTFELREVSTDPSGIAFNNGRFHVVYHDHSKVYAYRADGQRDATADFDLHVSSRNPLGITTAGDRFHVVNFNSVRAFRADGQRDPDADFYLDVENGNPGGIVHASGRFYVVDSRDKQVYAYRADGQRDPDADFNLDEENGFSTGIAHANGLFYVMDLADAKAYAYRIDGQREASSDFGVDGDNARPRGIAHAENWFSVVSRETVGRASAGEWVNKVYVYPHKGRYSPATHRVGDSISGLPAGTWVPAVTSAARSASDANGTRIALDDGGYVEEGGHRYSCQGAGGCEIANRIVVSGAILQTVAGQPGFHSGSLPGNLTFAPGSAIEALTLPAAGGGDGTLTYSLAPSVPGLSFDPATRRLTGTPTEAGRHAMIYTALDADGDRATLEFTIAVEAVGNFDLDGANGDPFGIAYANGRFHVLDIDQRKVYAYRSDGRRDPAADFDLHLRNNDPAGIAYANGRFYVVNTGERKVYAYREDGQRDASADFDLAQEVAFRIAYANGRFYVLDLALRKVYAYREDGQRDASVDFDLHGDSDDPHGIAYADGRVYVVDIGQRKVYTYRDDGQHEPAADFDLHRDNGGPFGIAYANGRLYVVDRGRHTVFAYGVDRPRDGDDGEPGGGTPGAGAPEPFDLHEANPAPFGIAYANDRFHVVDLALRKVYAYGADGQRDPAADFDLDDEVEQPFGIVHVNGRLYILDNIGRKVYAYTVSGQRVASADFNLHADNDFPTGIAYANGRFHVVDLGQRKVYAYRTDGQRDASADFDLHEDQWDAWRITYANGRFYVLTETQSKVFAYGEDGQRDPTVEFDLHEDNSRSNGIAYVNGRFYIVDLDRRKVYAYREAGQGNGAGSSGTFDLHRTNREPFGIAYANGRLYVVNWGDKVIYPYSTSGQRDTAAALDLDEANWDPGGIVYANGRFHVVDYEDKKIYAYTASGQRDTAADFDLHRDNDGPQGIAYANGRFYVVENGERRVYAYRDDGQRDASVEFDLHEDNDAPYGIAYANGRFYVVDHAHNKVFAYGANGQRDAAVDFDLHEDHEVAAGITYGDGRFYVVDTVQSKVYAYPDEGDEGAASGVPIFSAGAPINSLSNGLWGPGRQTVSAPGGSTYTAGTANTNSTPPSLGAGTALSVEITQCSGQQASPGSPGLSVGIEGTVRADAALSSVVVSGFGNGSLAGIDSLGSLAAGESRHFAIAETILAPQGALSCSVIAEYFDIGALARGEPVRDER